MNFLSIGQNQSFAASHAPYHGNIMLFPPTRGSSLASRQGVGIGKAEAPSDTTFGVGDAFAAGYGREVDGVEGAGDSPAGTGGVWCGAA